MKITSIGIDIGKTTFHLVGLDIHGSIVIRRKFSRKALLAYTVNLPSALIGIEACGGSHCLARRCGTKDTRRGYFPDSSSNPIASRTRTTTWMRKR